MLTCEHGGNRVPREWARCFASAAARRALASHRGWDPGALAVARALARRLGAPLYGATTSRLVVELNRSERHPQLFSEFTRDLPRALREAILNDYYRPHRDRVEAAIRSRVDAGRRVLHVGVHSFTPVLRGVTRNADLGLLYDPRRAGERDLCLAWAAAIRARYPSLRVRRNYPYRGDADGFTTYLRRLFPASAYLGIEVEMNQGMLARTSGRGVLERVVREVVSRSVS